jgi:drug/metabolite transporter (DMT)-like permease
MLRRQLGLVQWLALFLLFLGISLVQLENMTSTTLKQDVNPIYGFAAVIIACKYKKPKENLIDYC